MGSSMEEDKVQQETPSLPLAQPQSHFSNNLQGGFPVPAFPVTLSPLVLPLSGENSMGKLTLGPRNQPKTSPKLSCPIPILPVPPSSKMADLNLNQTSLKDSLPLSLKLSTPSSDEQSPPATHPSAFQAMSSGDSIISVA